MQGKRGVEELPSQQEGEVASFSIGGLVKLNLEIQ